MDNRCLELLACALLLLDIVPEMGYRRNIGNLASSEPEKTGIRTRSNILLCSIHYQRRLPLVGGSRLRRASRYSSYSGNRCFSQVPSERKTLCQGSFPFRYLLESNSEVGPVSRSATCSECPAIYILYSVTSDCHHLRCNVRKRQGERSNKHDRTTRNDAAPCAVAQAHDSGGSGAAHRDRPRQRVAHRARRGACVYEARKAYR